MNSTTLNTFQLTRVQSALRMLTLIEGNADSTSYLESLETIDKRRCAIREAATQAISDLEFACGLSWLPNMGGPTRRDGTPLASLPWHVNRFTGKRAARKAVR